MREKPPRVLHLSLIARIHQGTGIFQQLLLEREAACELGIPWSTEIFAPHAPSMDALDLPNQAPRQLIADDEQSLFSRVRMNLKLRRAMYRWLTTKQSEYDIILLRYVMHDRRLAHFMRSGSSMTGLVHHACEVPELLGLDGLVGQGRAYAEALVGKRTVAQADVLLAVTSEIAQYELDRVSPLQIPVLIYPNGGRDTPNPVIDRRGEVPEFLFVASHFSPWQGLDLLLDSLHEYDKNVVVHLVGTMNEADASRAHSDPRIVVHGMVDTPAIRRIAEQCWAGISSLATERQGLRVACPLKVREYLAMGLPTLGAHFEELPSTFPFYARIRPQIASIVEKGREWRTTSRMEVANCATSVVSKKGILEKTYSELAILWAQRQEALTHG